MFPRQDSISTLKTPSKRKGSFDSLNWGKEILIKELKMEISLSRKSFTNIIGLILITLVLIGGYYAWSHGLLDRWLDGGTPQTQPVTDPAIQSLAAFYAPSGDRVQWEEQVCAGMTVKGCQLFRALYANPLWNSAQGQTASVAFIAVAETLEDGSQIWKTDVTTSDSTLPVYIHVSQNEAGQWLLNRVLFEQEAAKYENSSTIQP